MVKFIGVDDNGNIGPDASKAILKAVDNLGLSKISKDTSRVTVIGDSLSALNYASNKGHSWWETALSNSGGVLVKCYAKAGETLGDALRGWDAATNSVDPANSQTSRAARDDSETWLVMLGSNDVAQSRPVEDFSADVDSLVDSASDNGRNLVMVTPPRPLYASAYSMGDFDAMIAALREVTSRRGVTLIDIWDKLGDPVNGLPAYWDIGDGQHMTPEAHESIGRLVAPRLQEAIGGSPGLAMWSDSPFPSVNISGDGESTAAVVNVPLTSRDLFPSGKAHLVSLAHGTGKYVSMNRLMENTNGRTFRLTFSYEIVSMDPASVIRDRQDSGLYVQVGGVPTWDFYTVWGGLKTEGARGVASLEHTFPVDSPNTNNGFNIVVSDLRRLNASDPKIEVRIGAVRIEEVI